MTLQYTPRMQWRSSFGFIMVTAGAVIGLGNVVKFPSLVAQFGAPFVLLYLLFTVTIGLPLFLAELLMGRRARSNPVDAMALLSLENSRSKWWKLLAWLGAGILLVTLATYSVKAGWAMNYFYLALESFHHAAPLVTSEHLWQNLISNPPRMLFWSGLFTVIVGAVVARGITQGLERFSIVSVTALFGILIGLAVYVVMLTGMSAFTSLMDFSTHQLTHDSVVAALAYSCFTLSVGMGVMLVYGSYLPQRSALGKLACWVIGLDVLASLLAAVIVLPLYHAYHIPALLTQGALFETLFTVLTQSTFGHSILVLFFLILLLAALTSAIAFLEPIVAICCERYGWRRPKVVGFFSLATWSLGWLYGLSLGDWSSVTWIQTVLVSFPDDIVIPFTGLGFAVFAGWMMSRDESHAELGFRHEICYKCWRVAIRYLVPLAYCGIILTT